MKFMKLIMNIGSIAVNVEDSFVKLSGLKSSTTITKSMRLISSAVSAVSAWLMSAILFSSKASHAGAVGE
jgi:hypothetical protein